MNKINSRVFINSQLVLNLRHKSPACQWCVALLKPVKSFIPTKLVSESQQRLLTNDKPLYPFLTILIPTIKKQDNGEWRVHFPTVTRHMWWWQTWTKDTAGPLLTCSLAGGRVWGSAECFSSWVMTSCRWPSSLTSPTSSTCSRQVVWHGTVMAGEEML